MMLPRWWKYSGANFWDLRKDDVMDWDEMRGAYMRATQDDIVTRLRDSKLDCDYCDSWHINGQAADEIERLRAENRELQSEIHRLEKLANYG